MIFTCNQVVNINLIETETNHVKINVKNDSGLQIKNNNNLQSYEIRYAQRYYPVHKTTMQVADDNMMIACPTYLCGHICMTELWS